jgi:hypothetical protein
LVHAFAEDRPWKNTIAYLARSTRVLPVCCPLTRLKLPL